MRQNAARDKHFPQVVNCLVRIKIVESGVGHRLVERADLRENHTRGGVRQPTRDRGWRAVGEDAEDRLRVRGQLAGVAEQRE